jgi:uncharacterized circularly permuted ATP-grasp superfamily protein/uncharacterized alpha-E superfamily protein
MMQGTDQESLFQHYFSDGYSYDELLGEDGNLRPHWQTFFHSFAELGQEELLNRNQDVLRFLKENGVTYNIYGDPAGLNRPWNLDLVPFLISKQEWQTIESGLKQRAELFNHILKDIYGERRLIRNGLLPMELIYQHPGFLRQCAGIPLPGKHHLIMYSADMARSTDGKIWILNDRTQAPSGSGYALENRMAMARMLPELFDGFKVRRLSSYFNALRNALVDMAPQKQDPRIVILTPGPENETYFEHAYLSSYLGFTLALGDDLMVKDNYVYLKTIGGLEKVDVILRRVDDIFCDPLELLEKSQLGVPGLLQVVRSGNVSIANPLGSSILETPGLMPFLQGIAKYFLGEELIMPTIASWWCGQEKEAKYVMENLDSLVIKRVSRVSGEHGSIDGTALSAKEMDELRTRIKAQPNLYVGQEKVSIAATPSLINGKIEPRKALFRSFVVSGQEGYTVMTGGLTRTSAEKGNFIISNQLGGISKDTWIISPESGGDSNPRREHVSSSPVSSSVASGIITSHIAENLYWVGRYAERVLGNARFQRTVMQFITEGDRRLADNDGVTEYCLLMALTQCTYTFPGFTGADGEQKLKQPWKELHDLLFDTKKPGSLNNNFLLFNNAVHAVRDHWSTDTWRVLREMEECFNLESAQGSSHRMLKTLDNIITAMVAFIGLNRESISREQGWILLDTGRKIEQSLLLVNMLQTTLLVKQDEQVDYNLLEAVLKSHECLVNYRYKYRAHLQLPLLLDLMLFDPTNPRSLLYQLDRLKAYLSQLPKAQKDNALTEHERLILEAHTLLRLSSKEELLPAAQGVVIYENLEDFLNRMQALLYAAHDVVSKTYFKHAKEQRQLYTLDNI